MNVTKTVKSWLIFFRAHTAILEAPMAALGAALALGSFWEVGVLKWVGFGVLYHFVGYGMNSYADWKNGYDKNDPNKEHHPLNTGDISSKVAKFVVQVSTVSLLVYGVVASGLDVEPLVVLFIMVLVGVSYNYLGKATEHKYLLVALVHSLVFVLPYVAYQGSISPIIWVAVLAYFVHHVFQILISGDVKDVEMDESSLVQSLGMSIENTDAGKKLLDVDPSVVAISYLVTILEGVIVIAILLYLHPPTTTVVLTLVMMAWMIIEVDDIIGEGAYDRPARVAAMSRKELAGLWMIFAAFTGQIGLDAWLGMVGFSLLYFIPVSKLMWGSITPDV